MRRDEVAPSKSTRAYTFTYSSGTDDQPLVAVVEAVSWVKDVDPIELEPLHHAIDTQELAAYFSGSSRGDEFTRSSAGGEDEAYGPKVTFEYEECIVTIASDRIEVRRV